MLILLDSGSSHTFISAKLAAALSHPGLARLQKPLVVKVASGTSLDCDSQITQAMWEIQGLQFYSDMKVIHLDHFDMVLGFD
jgi:hypothetical protein